MLTTILSAMTANAFKCPTGLVAKDSKLELFHVHDFNFDSRPNNPSNVSVIHEQVSRLFTSLDSEFDGKASYSIVSPMDKSKAWETDTLAYNCGESLVKDGAFHSDDQDEIKALNAALTALSDPKNYTASDRRTNIFDPVYHRINEWARDVEVEDDLIKIISISTSACPYIAKNWQRIPVELQMLWTQKRHVPTDLPSDDLLMCSAHDYPRQMDIATIAAEQNVIVLMMVNADKDAICQESEFYPEQNDLVKQWWLEGFGERLKKMGVKAVGYDATQEKDFPDFMKKVDAAITSLACYDPNATTTSSPGATGPVTTGMTGTETTPLPTGPTTTGTGSTTHATGTGVVMTTTGTGSNTTGTGTGVVMTTTGTGSNTTGAVTTTTSTTSTKKPEGWMMKQNGQST